MEITLEHYLILAGLIFTIGVFGIFLNRKNMIVILMSVELMLVAVNINLVAFAAFTGAIAGQIFALFVITIAAAEVGVGLALVLLVYRNLRSPDLDRIDSLKG